jgi:Mannosyl-glycoprotein endo-beta-N-acetylglucosaminidase
MRKIILMTAFLAATTFCLANNASAIVSDYISTYLDIASYESARTGIPVSIILGQGIMESDCGNSKLAQTANNHFGIKWKNEADGAYVMHKDDDKNNRGQLIASKFVKYGSVQQSYVHHSEFLRNRPNYQSLFQYDRTDYVQWALGLSRCGYATDPNYSTKLIKVIENNNLAQYDIPSVLSFEDEEELADDAPIAQATYETTNNNETEREELFEISTQPAVETRRSEMWETKAAAAKVDATEENGLFEITMDAQPLESKKKQSTVQKSKKTTH